MRLHFEGTCCLENRLYTYPLGFGSATLRSTRAMNFTPGAYDAQELFITFCENLHLVSAGANAARGAARAVAKSSQVPRFAIALPPREALSRG